MRDTTSRSKALSPDPNCNSSKAYKRHIGTNGAEEHARQQRAADVLVASTKGVRCFDVAWYRAKNPDLNTRYPDDATLFRHFLAKGILDYREHKWKCGLDVAAIVPPWP